MLWLYLSFSIRHSYLFFIDPYLIALGMAGQVFDRLISRDADGACNRFYDSLELAADVRGAGIHGGGGNLVNEAALLVRDHRDASGVRIAFNWFVFEIDEARRQKNKQQDERDHDVVMQRATFIRPENVSANCAPDGSHGGWWDFRHSQNHFGLQVYFGIHAIANSLTELPLLLLLLH